jgi:hypothetical protein
LQLSAGELAGDVPALTSVVACIEHQNVLPAVLFDQRLCFLEGIHGERQSTGVRGRADGQRRDQEKKNASWKPPSQ